MYSGQYFTDGFFYVFFSLFRRISGRGMLMKPAFSMMESASLQINPMHTASRTYSVPIRESHPAYQDCPLKPVCHPRWWTCGSQDRSNGCGSNTGRFPAVIGISYNHLFVRVKKTDDVILGISKVHIDLTLMGQRDHVSWGIITVPERVWKKLSARWSFL